MAFFEGSGLLQHVWLHPSRWPSCRMRTDRDRRPTAVLPVQGTPGRMAGVCVWWLGSAGQPSSLADPWLTLPAPPAHLWPRIPLPQLSFPSTNIEKINKAAARGCPRAPLHTATSPGSRAGADPAFLSPRVNWRESKYWLLWGLPQPVARDASCLRKGARGAGRSPSLAGVVAQVWLFTLVAQSPHHGLSLLLGARGALAWQGQVKPCG